MAKSALLSGYLHLIIKENHEWTVSVPMCDIETSSINHECNASVAYVIFISLTRDIPQTYELHCSVEMYWYKR